MKLDHLPIERMSRRAFEGLGEYSCSLPTGQRIGKCWKINIHAYNLAQGLPAKEPLWLIAEYVQHTEANKIGIDYRRIEIVE